VGCGVSEGSVDESPLTLLLKKLGCVSEVNETNTQIRINVEIMFRNLEICEKCKIGDGTALTIFSYLDH
jgi:hypothetical protein